MWNAPAPPAPARPAPAAPVSTPLLPEDRPKFTGIAYFAPDERYRLENVRLAPPASDEEKTFPIPTSDAQLRSAVGPGPSGPTAAARQAATRNHRIPPSPAPAKAASKTG